VGRVLAGLEDKGETPGDGERRRTTEVKRLNLVLSWASLKDIAKDRWQLSERLATSEPKDLSKGATQAKKQRITSFRLGGRRLASDATRTDNHKFGHIYRCRGKNNRSITSLKQYLTNKIEHKPKYPWHTEKTTN
jgi:hypothetical protein